MSVKSCSSSYSTLLSTSLTRINWHQEPDMQTEAKGKTDHPGALSHETTTAAPTQLQTILTKKKI